MNWCLSFVVAFASFLFPAFVLLGSMHLFNLFLRRVTAPTPPTITLLLSLQLLLRSSKLYLTPTLSNISNLIIFFQITSMARSTGDLLSYLTHTWSSSLRNFGESFVVALDISKAFDRVWHKALLAKLPAYGFTPFFCKLFSSFLSNRFISVVVDGAISAPFLSPMVFFRVLFFLQHFSFSL